MSELAQRTLELVSIPSVTREEAASAVVAPTNLAYQNHMLAVAARGTLGEAAAALLACPWTYHALGDVVVGVDVDEAGDDELSLRIDDSTGALQPRPDRADPAVADRNIRGRRRAPNTVDHEPSANC